MDRRRLIGHALLAPAIAIALRTTASAEIDCEMHGTLHRLAERGHGDNRATFMPDGKTILFASKRSGRSQIYAIDRQGGRPWRFLHSEGNDYGRIAPNAQGTQVCFSSDRSGQNLIYVLDIASGLARSISDPGYWSFGPSWSSHDLIAFFSRKGGNVMNLWTVRSDGTQSEQITDQRGESRQPWWSPDGTTVAFSADCGSGTFTVWLSNAAGALMRAVTRNGSFEQPFWSPDGKKLAVSARINGSNRQIYLMNADGSDLALIGQPRNVENAHPAWSPDGHSIVFTSGIEANEALYIFDLSKA
jgi:Tol biopolymer transport system component